jgi:hypothetical protein
MPDNLPTGLDQRLERLEIGLRRWKTAVAILGILLAGSVGAEVVALSSHGPAAIRLASDQLAAHQFVALDERGNPVAAFGSIGEASFLIVSGGDSPNGKNAPHNIEALADRAQKNGGLMLGSAGGGANLRLLGKTDAEGNSQSLDLSTSGFPPGTANLTISSSKGRSVSLTASDQSKADEKGFVIPGAASLSLSDASDKDKPISRETTLNLTSDGASALEFQDAALATRAHFGLQTNSEPSLDLSDSGSEQRLRIFLTENGDPNLALWGKGEKTYNGAYLTADSLSLQDNRRTARAIFGNADLENIKTGSTENTGPSAVTLLDKKGNVLWKAP